MEKTSYGNYALPVIIKLAEKYNVEYLLNDTYTGKCLILMFDKQNVALWDFPFNINHSAAIKVCTNKDICTSFLKRLGYKVPISENFTRRSTEQNSDLIPLMYEFLGNLSSYNIDYPPILKPSNLSQGTGIVKLSNFEDAKKAVQHLNDYKTKTFIIQEFIKGNDFRIVVLNGEVIQAYERVPFSITGNGTDSVKDLVSKKIEQFKADDRDKPVDIKDERLWKCVANAGFKPTDILDVGKTIKLQDIANLSLGGTSKDCTKSITNHFKKLSANIAKSLGLELCGIDILADSISDPKKTDYRILEVNSTPGLDNYLYSDLKKQNDYVESLYEKIFVYLLNKYSSHKTIEDSEEKE